MKFSLSVLLSLSSLVFALPVAETEITARDDAITTTEHLATTAHFFSEAAAAAVVSTENGLTTDACKPVIVIFARGTNEGVLSLIFHSICLFDAYEFPSLSFFLPVHQIL